MLKTITELQGVTVLSKDSQKKIGGGTAQACSMTYQDSQGVWHTEQGTCDEQINGYGPGGVFGLTATPYCHTASFSGPVALTSNGGVSKCGHWYAI